MISGHENSDPVIKLVAAIFRIAEIEKRAIEAGYTSLLSPEVSSTVMWFLRRWALTYLLAQECYYSEIRYFGRQFSHRQFNIYVHFVKLSVLKIN